MGNPPEISELERYYGITIKEAPLKDVLENALDEEKTLFAKDANGVIRALLLRGCAIKDLHPLALLTSLTHLRLENNQISDLFPLTRLSELLELRLDNNQVTDLRPAISVLKHLHTLSVAHNPLVQPPKKIALKGIHSILAYFETIDKMASNIGFEGRLENGYRRTPAVLSPTPDSHFSTVTIKNYRLLQDLVINKLSRVNVFAGPNNCGKTSLLEAIYLLCKHNDPYGLIDSVRYRGKLQNSQLPTTWLAEQIDEPLEIRGTFNHQEAFVVISQSEDEEADQARYIKNIDIAAGYGEARNRLTLPLFAGEPIAIKGNKAKILANVVYSSPFFLNEPHHYESFYGRAFRNALLPRIHEFLKSQMLPGLIDIRYLEQQFWVRDTQFAQAVDITRYGEGFQRVFLISLLFASAENGVLLIDEFENAIHADLLKAFIPFVLELSHDFNVQVFLTSHSKECVDAFARVSEEQGWENALSYHTLLRNPEGLVVHDLDGHHFLRLLNAVDVDLRRDE